MQPAGSLQPQLSFSSNLWLAPAAVAQSCACQSCPALERRVSDLEATVALLRAELGAVKAGAHVHGTRPSLPPYHPSTSSSASAKRKRKKRKAPVAALPNKRPCPAPEAPSVVPPPPASVETTPSLASSSACSVVEGMDDGWPGVRCNSIDGSDGTSGDAIPLTAESLCAAAQHLPPLDTPPGGSARPPSVVPPALSISKCLAGSTPSSIRRHADVLQTISPAGRSSFALFCRTADALAAAISSRAADAAEGPGHPQPRPAAPRVAIKADPEGLPIGPHPATGEPVRLPAALVACLRPHQVEGIRFLWTHLAGGRAAAAAPVPPPDSPLRFVGEPGGCVLADCMGLGKTLQVVSLALALTTSGAARTLLVLCPATVVRSWLDEFAKWLGPRCPDAPAVRTFGPSKAREDRLAALAAWRASGGVFLINYEMFRRLVQDGDAAFREHLCDPGPDVVVADEGHKLKDLGAALVKLIGSVRTHRRAVLTGYPLQNNLTEYYSMLEFVRPGCLGHVADFRRCFERPVARASLPRSTPSQRARGRRRAWLLHDALRPIVLRRDGALLQSQLPRKTEVTLTLRASSEQLELYRLMLAAIKSGDYTFRLHFWAYDVLVMLLGHPDILRAYAAARLAAAASSSSAAAAAPEPPAEAPPPLYDSDDDFFEPTPPPAAGAAVAAVPGSELIASRLIWLEAALAEMRYDERSAHSLHASPKMLMLLHIAVHAKSRGDRVVVFTRSLDAFRYIEAALARYNSLLLEARPGASPLAVEGFHGQVPLAERAARIARLNDSASPCDVFLISTLAGGEGITLTGANRVVLFDVSWNPCHDVEAACRIYRFGQAKPVTVYRLVTAGTIEEKVYARQLAKMGIAKWVVDDSNVRPCPPMEDCDIDRLLAEPARELLSMLEADEAPEAPAGGRPADRSYGDDLVDALASTYGRGANCPLIDVTLGESLFEEGPEASVREEDRELARTEFAADNAFARAAEGASGQAERRGMAQRRAGGGGRALDAALPYDFPEEEDGGQEEEEAETFEPTPPAPTAAPPPRSPPLARSAAAPEAGEEPPHWHPPLGRSRSLDECPRPALPPFTGARSAPASLPCPAPDSTPAPMAAAAAAAAASRLESEKGAMLARRLQTAHARPRAATAGASAGPAAAGGLLAGEADEARSVRVAQPRDGPPALSHGGAARLARKFGHGDAEAEARPARPGPPSPLPRSSPPSSQAAQPLGPRPSPPGGAPRIASIALPTAHGPLAARASR